MNPGPTDSTRPPSDKAVLGLVLGELKAGAPYFSLDTIRQKVSDAGLTLKDASLKVYLTEAVKLGRIHDAGRGWYSGLATRATLDPHPVAKVEKLLAKAFPLLDFHVWSSRQANPWKHHLAAKGVTFVYTDAFALEPVWECLRGADYDAHLNPTGAEKKKFSPGADTVVVRRRVTETPDDGHFATPEVFLVDLTLESLDLGLADAEELRDLAHTALTSARFHLPALLRYAKRRNGDFSEILKGLIQGEIEPS